MGPLIDSLVAEHFWMHLCLTKNYSGQYINLCPIGALSKSITEINSLFLLNRLMSQSCRKMETRKRDAEEGSSRLSVQPKTAYLSAQPLKTHLNSP